ncbi:cell wall hydrolase [Aurantiacibacter poecillastricola]|uniref:cell wall hydrolase n=1 Tax=Aurantiacibacter poecillastricola TaxID=3064385 RepID=UPI00273E3122|nr:cell wall hydrolase [Aurantiacibacter sp. 219JJ12-13]MDP5261647.1 cell wall hydrolase [Aurantiacibacter sp. 219JJ12-13]
MMVRRLGALLTVLAVPALAAETAFEPDIEQAPTHASKPMGFEIPGESFPGSAFYYLEDVALTTASFEPAPASGGLASPVTTAALPLVARGSGTDIMRAQECLASAIYYEAASESEAGQRAVAQVVLNRVAHRAWPSTVCGVVFQGSARATGCQFTFTCDGSLARRPSRNGWERASRIARAALAGVVYEPVGLSTHYHTLAVHPYWAPSLTRSTVIGAHIFYRTPGQAGEQGAFSFTYRGGEPQPGRSLAASGPDPVDLAQASTPETTEDVRTEVAALSAAPETPAPVAAGSELLPQSGAVRSEYANSGRWIEQP